MTPLLNHLNEILHLPTLYIPYIGEISFTPILVSIALYFLARISFWFIQFIIIKNFAVLANKTQNDFDNLLIDSVKKVRPWFYVYLSFYLALLPFTLPEVISFGLTTLLLILIAWQIIDIIIGIISYVIEKMTHTGDGDRPDPNATTAAAMLQLVARIVLWALGIIFVLSNLGFEVTSLVAGLGIGGIAIAFALQGILADLFASFSIYFDKPFRIGDTISVGTDTGTVEKIGIKSTRIRTLQGEELIISNAELVKTRIQNFRRMVRRRATAQIGVTYDTPPAKVALVPKIIEEIFNDIAHADFDRAFFTTFGESALIIDVVYYIDDREIKTFLTAQQAFNLKLLERCNQEGIEFAFPTRTIIQK
jgi:small-conductance mechanosensitive channel